LHIGTTYEEEKDCVVYNKSPYFYFLDGKQWENHVAKVVSETSDDTLRFSNLDTAPTEGGLQLELSTSLQFN